MGAHGVVRQVAVSTSTAEPSSSAWRRSSRKTFAQMRQRRLSRRGAIVAVAVGAVALAVAVAVAFAVYFVTSDSKLALSSSNAAEALKDPEPGQPYFALCAACLGTATDPDAPESDAYLLVRIDEAARQLTFVAVPSNVTVATEGDDAVPLYRVRADSGDAELVRRVGEIAQVDIAHFAYTNADGLAGMVDAEGGLPYELDAEVDDPRAGTLVMARGERTLTGEEALVFLRATNFPGGFQTASYHRVDFTLALASRALSAPGLDFAGLVGNLGSYASTDYTSSELIALGDALRPLEEATVYKAVMAGHTSANTGNYVYDDAAWEALMGAVKAGQDPNTATATGAAVNTSDVRVEVRNGTNATGMAHGVAELLEREGYKVGEVGNTYDGIVYPETLIIYKDEAFEPAARAVASLMQGGRVINGGDFYAFSDDVLVILGSDWMPVS